MGALLLNNTKIMKLKVNMLGFAAIVAAMSLNLNVNAADLEALPVQLPKPSEQGTPADIELSEHVEKPSKTPRAAFMAPKGVKNLALGKKVTSSDKNPLAGNYDILTDGNKECTDEYLELHRKAQWVQVDLESPVTISAILVWHSFQTPQVYRDIVIQGSNDPEFKDGVETLYNNDYDNSLTLGEGKDLEYFETHEGRLVDCKNKKFQYVRFYSNGSTYSKLNRYIEIEVWGLEK